MGHSKVSLDAEEIGALRTDIFLTRRRAEQTALVCVQMSHRFDDLERIVRGLAPKPKYPLPSNDPEYVASVARMVAAEERKDALLLAGATAEGLRPLDLAALDKADEEVEAATASHRAKSGTWKKYPDGPPPRTSLISDAMKTAIERGYECVMRAATEREKWGDLPRMSDTQKAALDEIYLQALNISRDDHVRGFALFMVWCEGCAADTRHLQTEKSPRHMLLSSDLCLVRELGPESVWWTVERANTVWQSQTQADTST